MYGFTPQLTTTAYVPSTQSDVSHMAPGSPYIIGGDKILAPTFLLPSSTTTSTTTSKSSTFGSRMRARRHARQVYRAKMQALRRRQALRQAQLLREYQPAPTPAPAPAPVEAVAHVEPPSEPPWTIIIGGVVVLGLAYMYKKK